MKSPERVQPNRVPAIASRIIRRFGGRHLIFRTKVGGWSVIPRSYLLISSFKGPVWVFYGVGQIWLTHRKAGTIGDWIIRSPRVASRKLMALVEKLRPELEGFVGYCNRHGIEGSIVIEQRVIEFHWVFGGELPREDEKPEFSSPLHLEFAAVVHAFERHTLTDEAA